MLPRAAGDETREREMGGLELDLLGLGLLPAATTEDAGGNGGGGSAAQQRSYSYEKTGFDEPLRFAAATETPSPVRGCVPRPVDMDVDDGGVVVPAAPSSMPKQPAWAPAAQAPPSPKVPSSSTPSSDHQLAAAAGQGRAHYAVATLASPPLMQRAPCCPTAGRLFFGTSRPPVAAGAGLIFEDASASAAAAQSTHDVSTAPMTIVYAGSVRAYDGVTLEQAEKILAMVAKEEHAAGILAEPQLELVAAAQMTMHWRLAHHVNDSHKRTASLARFLDKRKQRAEMSAATMLHRHPRSRREEWFPAQIMDAPAALVSARTSASLGGMDRRPRASQDHPKRMKASRGEEAAVSTELRI